MQFAKNVYLAAGAIGLLMILPLFIIEGHYATDESGLLAQPEFYYGFACVTLAWQIAFILMSRDPVRFRPLMPVTMVEKFSFAVAMFWLASQGRVGQNMVSAAAVDCVWGALFYLAWKRTEENRLRSSSH